MKEEDHQKVSRRCDAGQRRTMNTMIRLLLLGDPAMWQRSVNNGGQKIAEVKKGENAGTVAQRKECKKGISQRGNEKQRERPWI